MILDLLDYRTVRNDPSYDPKDHKIAGIMSQSTYWRDFIKNILPHGSEGYLTVFESPCNPTFTYEINGPDVKYMGVGDVQASKYADMEVSSLLQDLFQYNTGSRTYSYVPLEQDLCPWTVRVLPSQKLEDIHTTNNPLIYTLAAIAIFAFTAMVFIAYDLAVERRQRVVMHSAEQTNKVC